MGIHIDDLSFRRDLFQLAEAMQYAFNSEPKSDYDKQNKRYWVGQVLSSSKPDVAKEINAIKTKYADELAKSPLLLGLLDMYVAASETDDREKFKDIYLAYQNLQKDVPFETNKQAYVEAGCGVTAGLFGEDEDKLFVMYPIHLFSSYSEKGGRSDDHRGGYLYPVHQLTLEEAQELYEINPNMFTSPKTRNAFNGMKNSTASQPGSEEN